MEVDLEYMSEEEFNRSNYQILFISPLSNRKFAQVKYKNKTVLIAWQSELIKPFVVEIKSGVYAVGVDLSFGVIDFNLEHILFRFETNSFISDLKKINGTFYLLTELAIYDLDLKRWEVKTVIDLPDILVDFLEYEDHIIIECMDGTEVRLEKEQ